MSNALRVIDSTDGSEERVIELLSIEIHKMPLDEVTQRYNELVSLEKRIGFNNRYYKRLELAIEESRYRIYDLKATYGV
jgi:hypothetical protein